MRIMLRYLSICTFIFLTSLMLKACRSQEQTSEYQEQTSEYYVLSFDGVDDYIEIEDTSIVNQIGDGDFTFETWVKASEDNQVPHPQIFSNRQTDGQGFLFGFHDRWRGSANKIPYVQLDSINWIDYPEQPNLLDGQWHHFAARRESNTLTYFADGQPVASLTTEKIGNYDISSNQALLIGWDLVNQPSTPFAGELDEIRIWSRALEDTEIQSGMLRSTQIDKTGLVGYWSFDEGSGEVVNDRSGNNYHGMIFGASWLPEQR